MAKLISPQILTPSATLLLFSNSNPTRRNSLPFANSAMPIANLSFFQKLGIPRFSVGAVSSAAASADDIADVLGEISIFTAAGEPVKFSELWDQNEGIAVVALMRHFGCFCSWDFAALLRESKERFESAGVKLIAVGVGSPDNAQLFSERLPFPLDSLYADPERKAYDALGLYFGLRRTFFSKASAKVFSRMDAIKKNMKNYTLKATPDDRSSVLQQGGMLVFKGKQLLYAMKEEGPGDHASLDVIFDICSKASTA